ncbi:hypothetical protein [Bradyrhizobium sp. OAE829]|uniref:hypothetical protein n=1 Tax=Bradyrhizobium sp. OAE829 TaxID=2663807 RepID=UPI00178A636B
MTEIEKNGTDVLREAVRVRVKTMRYAGLARDLSVAAETSVAFSEGRTTLPPEILSALAKQLWGRPRRARSGHRLAADDVTGAAPAGRCSAPV